MAKFDLKNWLKKFGKKYGLAGISYNLDFINLSLKSLEYLITFNVSAWQVFPVLD